MKTFLTRLNRINPKQLRYSTLEFLFWATFAAYYPFIVVFLQDKGFSNTTTGTIIAINSLIAVFAQPFWGLVSDKLQSVKKVYIFCLAIAILLAQLIPFALLPITAGIIFAIITFFESPLAPLLDSWVIQGIREEKKLSYGPIRLWGSIGFAILVYIYGEIIDLFSVNLLYLAFLAIGFGTIFMCTTIKNDKPLSSVDLKNLNISKLLGNYYYVSFLIFSIILFIPHKSSFLFLSNIMESVGGTKGDLGMAFSIMAISEVPIFLFSRKLLKKYKPVHLILISCIFFIMRQLILLVATCPTQIILMQLLQGPSYALFLNGAVYYIDEMAPYQLKSTAQTLATAIFSGVSGIIGSYSGGWIIDNYGLNTLYYFGVWATIGTSVLFLISLRLGSKTFKHR